VNNPIRLNRRFSDHFLVALGPLRPVDEYKIIVYKVIYFSVYTHFFVKLEQFF